MNQARLKELLRYDPETGIFTWVRRQGVRPGSRAGCVNTSGYRMLVIDGKVNQEHRLAWIYVHGQIPDGMHVDHINGDKQDNRISNLRPCTRSQNLQNQRKAQATNKIGVLGAYFEAKRGKYKAMIRVNGKDFFLGRYATAEEAGAAYLAAKRRLHEFCTI